MSVLASVSFKYFAETAPRELVEVVDVERGGGDLVSADVLERALARLPDREGTSVSRTYGVGLLHRLTKAQGARASEAGASTKYPNALAAIAHSTSVALAKVHVPIEPLRIDISEKPSENAVSAKVPAGPSAPIPGLHAHQGMDTFAATPTGFITSHRAALKAWNNGQIEPAHVLPTQDSQIHSSTVLPGGKIALGHDDGTVTIWQLDRAWCEQTLPASKNDYAATVIALENGLLLKQTRARLQVWKCGDTGEWGLLCTMKLTARDRTSDWHFAALSPERVAVSTGLGVVRVLEPSKARWWKLFRQERGALVQSISTGKVDCLASIGGGRFAWSAGERVFVSDPANKANKFMIVDGKANISAMTSLGNGRLALGFADGAVEVWDIDGKKCLLSDRTQSKMVNYLAVLSDGTLASTTNDGNVVAIPVPQ